MFVDDLCLAEEMRKHKTETEPWPTVSIVGTGSYLPECVMTNADLEEMIDTTDEWIYTRTGMKERRIAAGDEAASDMAAQAGRRALDDAGLGPEDVEMIVVATSTPDMLFPSTACLVQYLLNAHRAFCFDIAAACSGFLYALEVAQKEVASGRVKTALVIGSEKMSSIVDWQDRSTCVLFGDGAGAAVLQATGAARGIMSMELGSNGSLGDLLMVPGGGSRRPLSREVLEARLNYIKMEGRDVFKHAVTHMANAVRKVVQRNGLTVDDIDCIIPHQANTRIINAIAQRIEAPLEKVYLNVEKYGNTSAASVIIALDEAVRAGRINAGDMVLLVVFGAGFTWGASIVECCDRSFSGSAVGNAEI